MYRYTTKDADVSVIQQALSVRKINGKREGKRRDDSQNVQTKRRQDPRDRGNAKHAGERVCLGFLRLSHHRVSFTIFFLQRAVYYSSSVPGTSTVRLRMCVVFYLGTVIFFLFFPLKYVPTGGCKGRTCEVQYEVRSTNITRTG